MSTISNKTITQTVTLGTVDSYPTYASPLTIAATGTIETGTTTAAIYGPGTQAWTVVNSGLITNGAGDGIALHQGGAVTNNGGGTIVGAHDNAILVSGAAGTVTNAGRIAAFQSGVALLAGGTVINQVGGTIGGAIGDPYTSGILDFVGVAALNTPAAVTNAGAVIGYDTGIRLWSGGTVVNQAGGTISGFNTGIDLRGAGGYVTNAGNIIATSGSGINLTYGSVYNSPGGTIAAPGIGVSSYQFSSDPVGAITITNAGTISGGGGSYGGFGVYLHAGGVVDNQSGGSIVGASDAGVYIKGDGTVINAGTIASAGTGGSAQYSAAIQLNYGGGSINNGGLLQAYRGVNVYGSAATVTNTGTIASTGTFAYAHGVYLKNGGSVDNAGLIQAYRGGIWIENAVGTVSNNGTIEATGTFFGIGIELLAGGWIDNTGRIEGGYLGVGAFAAGTVSNSGTILSTSNMFPAIHLHAVSVVDNAGAVNNTGLIQGFMGVLINGTGAVTNSATILGNIVEAIGIVSGEVTNTGTGVIEGADGVFFSSSGTGILINSATIAGTGGPGYGRGVRLTGGGTVVNRGTISGASGTAISFGGTGANLLVLESGYQLVGGVFGSSTATNTLELFGTTGAAVSANYNGLGLTYFTDVLLGGSGYATLRVTNTSGMLGVTISGFDAASDVIDLTGIGANGAITYRNTATDRITVSGSLGSLTVQFDSIDGINFSTASDGSGGTELAPVCYCRGTQILTDRGEVAVEELGIGDRVMTLSGEAKPVKWLGHRAYDGRFVAGNRAMLPVRIRAGALADGVPVRDLCVSPGHALLIAGLLVRAEYLVNGATITRDAAVDRLEYFHIELEAHDILIADGAPAESYIDCDNRAKFHNAGDFARLYPDDERPRWQYCAPLLDWDSPELNAIRAKLMGRAGPLGHRLDLNPDLHLVVDGTVIPPTSIDGQSYRFAVPAGAATVALASRTAVPAEVRADSRDRRRLGVPFDHLVLFDDLLFIQAEHGHPALDDGFHDDEATHRWTDGLAHLPERWVHSFPGEFAIEVRLIPSELPYRLPPIAPAATRRAA